jgi:hypothetical protein
MTGLRLGDRVFAAAAFLASQCQAKVPPRLTPLKTKPAVDIARGSEVRGEVWAAVAACTRAAC